MPPSRIAKNTAYLTMAFTAQKILSFAYFAFIARFIGNDDAESAICVRAFFYRDIRNVL